MLICRVMGSVVSTHKNSHFKGKKILIIQPLDLDLKPKGSDLLGIDTVGAGPGDLVLVNKEGSGARLVLNDEKIPLQALIVGVIDGVDIFK